MEQTSPKMVFSFIEVMNKTKEPLVVVITTHLYTEYLVDLIIKYNSKNPSKLFKWNYANKLEYVYNLDLIPLELYQNLTKLNKLRNQCAHDLHFNFSQVSYKDYNLWKDAENMKDIDTSDELFNTSVIGYITYAWLDNHCRNELGLLEEPIND